MKLTAPIYLHIIATIALVSGVMADRDLSGAERLYGAGENGARPGANDITADEAAKIIMSSKPHLKEVIAKPMDNGAIRVSMSHYHAECGPYTSAATTAGNLKTWISMGMRQCRIPLADNQQMDCWQESGKIS